MRTTENKDSKVGVIGILVCLALLLMLSSCAEVARDMGIDDSPDIELRSGPVGSQSNPSPLDPFKRYDLIMAANECRFFSMKVPERWFWKVYLTGANRRENAQARISAYIGQSDQPFASVPETYFEKTMILNREGDQVVLGVGNKGPARVAILRICQEGAPVHVTIESQVSSTSDLLGPKGNHPGFKK